MTIIIRLLVMLLLPLLTSNMAMADDASKAPVDIDLSGQWKGDYGPVTLQQDGLSITGSYEEGTAARPKPGTITSGTFNLATRILVITTYQDWNKMKGSATFTLSQDGTRLNGTTTESGPDGSFSGRWDLWRN